jgi:hypothetical protein
VWDEPAGVIERGVKKDLSTTAAGAQDPGAEEHVGLPDLVAELGLELLVCLGSQELPFRQAALFEKAIESRRGNRRLVVAG